MSYDKKKLQARAMNTIKQTERVTSTKINAYNVNEGYEKPPFRYSLAIHTYSVLSLSVHCDGIRSRVEQGDRDYSKFVQYLVHLNGNNFNQNIAPPPMNKNIVSTCSHSNKTV